MHFYEGFPGVIKTSNAVSGAGVVTGTELWVRVVEQTICGTMARVVPWQSLEDELMDYCGT